MENREPDTAASVVRARIDLCGTEAACGRVYESYFVELRFVGIGGLDLPIAVSVGMRADAELSRGTGLQGSVASSERFGAWVRWIDAARCV